MVASTGGILVGLGMILASFGQSPAIYVVGFGILAGAGIGFGYASATPPAVKWFPPARTGLVAGIVVSGFGLASVYAAPLAKWLAATYGLSTMMRVLGVAFLIVVVGLAQLLTPPHKVLQFMARLGPVGEAIKETEATKKKEDYTPREMLGTGAFYQLWFMYACGAGAGLMIISKLAAIADKQAGLKLGFVLVAVLAVGNGAGRVIAGVLSDKIGRKATMFVCFVSQAVMVFLLSQTEIGNFLAITVVMAVVSALIGANYGANLALFPSITKDYYGLKNFGMNYGLVFTSWGVGGFVMALVAGKLYDKYQTFSIAYYGASILLILAAILVFLVRPPKHAHEES